MSRANIAAIVGIALLSTSACGSTSQVTMGGRQSTGPMSAGFQPAKGSACLNTPTTGTSSVMVDWVDFVRLHGRQYVRAPGQKVSTVGSDRLGAVIGRIECQLSTLKFHSQPGPSVDGDAAFLGAGTRVHALRGYPTSCQVVVRVGGVNRVYVAHADVSGVSKPLSCAEAH